ncbi:hypothetical protein MSIMFB_03935 [Mycobacterium simulans]|uniref:Uncharacterized protein n=2 Tax=Mycobacterium simulans TaxID=627089 RepID=A0A7Z7NBW9_9MYCO|nr:hypothetical protein MSIMFB_03935 [Mycobacterium simulans]
MRVTSFTAQNPYPATQFDGNGVGKGGDALIDCALGGLAVTGRVGDDHPVGVEELQHAPDAGVVAMIADRADVGFMDRGLGAEPAQQDPQGQGRGVARRRVPPVGTRVAPEFLEQRLGGRCQRGQPLHRTDGEAAPVTACLEQHCLGWVDQVRRHGRLRDLWCEPAPLLWSRHQITES